MATVVASNSSCSTRVRGIFDIPAFFEQSGELINTALLSDVFSRVYTQFSPESPQIVVMVDRDRMAALGVDYGQAMSTFSFYFGGSYVNDTFE